MHGHNLCPSHLLLLLKTLCFPLANLAMGGDRVTGSHLLAIKEFAADAVIFSKSFKKNNGKGEKVCTGNVSKG